MENESVCFKCLVLLCVIAGGFAHSIQYISDSNNTSDDPVFHTLTSEDYGDEVKVDFPVSDDIQLTEESALDAWSVVWYVASFGGLILFFLIVSCSEWCCRQNARRRCQRTNNAQTLNQAVPETPPPSYDLFAPPSYEDLWGASGTSMEKRQYDVYVVPVHALGNFMVHQSEAPPPYPSVSDSPQLHSNNRVT